MKKNISVSISEETLLILDKLVSRSINDNANRSNMIEDAILTLYDELLEVDRREQYQYDYDNGILPDRIIKMVKLKEKTND